MYLTGAYRRSQTEALIALGVGVMLTPGSAYEGRVEAEGFPCWAADNGCFAQGERFRAEGFYRWLDRVPRSRLLFVVAPDVFGDARATRERAAPFLAEFQRRGLPAAFVAQNGADRPGMVPWDDFAWLFIGGDNRWKRSVAMRALILEARRRGKRVHMGRVNSERRILYAANIGCESADGTYLRYRNRRGRDGVTDVRKWLRQATLPL